MEEGHTLTFTVGAVIITFIAFIGLLRIALLVISKKLKRKHGIEFGIGSFGFLELKGIWIKNGETMTIQIKQVSIVSGFLNRTYLKPLNIIVGPVEVLLSDRKKTFQDLKEIKPPQQENLPSVQKQSSGSIGKRTALYIMQVCVMVNTVNDSYSTKLKLDKYQRMSKSNHGFKGFNEKALAGSPPVFSLQIEQYIGISIQEITISASQDDLSFVCRSKIDLKVDSPGNEGHFGISVGIEDATIKTTEGDEPIMESSFFLDIHAKIEPTDVIKSSDIRVKLSRSTCTCREGLLKRVAKRNKKIQTGESISNDLENVVESKHKVPVLQKLQQSPKNVALILEDCKIVYMSSRDRDIYLSWHCEMVWKRCTEIINETRISSYDVSLDLTGLVVNTSCNKLLLNKQIECNLKFLSDEHAPSATINFNLDTFHASVIQEELNFWILEAQKFLPATGDKSGELAAPRELQTQSKLLKSLKDVNCSLHVIVQNCSSDIMATSLKTQQSYPIINSYLGKLEINVDSARQDGTYCSAIRSTVVLSDLYAFVNKPESCSSSCCTCVDGADRPAVLPASEHHVWGRIAEIGKISIEIACDQFQWDISKPVFLNASGQISYVGCEVSLPVAYAFKELFCLIQALVLKEQRDVAKKQKPNKGVLKIHLDAEMRIANINVFLLGERQGGANSLLAKMNGLDISTGSKDEPMLWEVNELKLCRLNGIAKDDSFSCVGSESLEANIVYVPSVSACLFRKKEPMSLTVSIQDCSVCWDTSKHMVIYEQLNSFLEAKDVFKDLVVAPRKEVTDNPSTVKIDMKIDIITSSLTMMTSKHNSFGVLLENLSFHSSEEETCVKACDVKILFDEKPIFKLQETELKKFVSEKLIESRKKYAEISLENKNAFCFTMESCHIVFPYQFDFATSLEGLLNVFKMLKLLHKKPKPPTYKEPLPPDLHIICTVLVFELEDDPFEVKLEENYLLRMDEMEECLERERKLKERLSDIQGAFISSQKIEAIMKNLAEKNAQIYIKRSMAIHQDNAKRTILFKCACRDIELMILGDDSLHGKENVLRNMKDIDDKSPLPVGIEFNTLWCRMIDGSFKVLTMALRDYQQPLLQVEAFNVTGRLIGAEQQADSDLSIREGLVEIDSPWENINVKKNMPSLKFYHDMTWDMDFFQVAWGVNVEPVWATVSQGFDLLSKASVDPSKPLPFWDKMRLLFHGKLIMKMNELNLLLSASRDPNNTTEKMVIVWERVLLNWTNACIDIEGDFDMQFRTASKYDDSRVLHFPGFKVRFDLEWICEGDPNDHHRAVPCNPLKLSDFEDHDSYRMFRSEDLNMVVTLETGKNMTKEQMKNNPPSISLYASTLRWLQKYQAVVLSNVSRPIRRGSFFGNVKPRKPSLGRHYKFVNVDFCFSRLRVSYFGSFTQEAGFEMTVSSGKFGVNYQVDVQDVIDDLNLTRRPVANWILRGLHSELDKVTTDLVSNLPETDEQYQGVDDNDVIEIERQTKNYFLFSVKRVLYNRQSPSSDMSSYTHKVELNDFRGAWTAFNRKITFELFEAYENMQMLKRVLSSEALKPSKDTTSQDFRRQHKDSFLDLNASGSRVHIEHDNRLLQQLVSEQESKFMAQVEEGENESEGQPKNSEEDDVIQLNWHIELVNSQVMLKGSESKGALLITAANTEILKRLHRPVGANNDVLLKLNKVTWNGKLNNLQYFATSKDLNDNSSSSIPWVNASVISGMPTSDDTDTQSNVAAFMKSSYCVGSIVNVSVGGVTTELQRVVSPSHCEFNYVSLDPELDPFAEEFEPTQYKSSTAGASFSPQMNLANTLLIRHPSLEISTSPDQYAMIMEICQTLLLYTEPKKRAQQDRFEKMKFRMQLSIGEDTKGDIQELQDCVRDSLSYLRRCERQLFEYRRKADSISSVEDDSLLDMALELKEAIVDLQEQIEATKEQLMADSEELKIMIRIYKDFALTSASPSPNKNRIKNYIVKQSDIIFDDMRWRLTQRDGQLGIADVQFKKFHYNKLTFNDNGVEHRLELGGFAVCNLIPNEPYKELLVPHEINLRRHVDKSVFVRVYCRVQSPVAGINVREHFEVNVCPIAVRLTHRFYHYLMSFFFTRKFERPDQTDGMDFDIGTKGREDGEDSQNEQVKTQQPFKKPAPPRPPPPKTSQAYKQQQLMSSPIKPAPSQPMCLDIQAEERLKKKPTLSISLASPKDGISPPIQSPGSGNTTPSRTPSVKKSSSFYNRFSTDENVDRMKERAEKNQTFIYIKIPEVPICFSYKGEKDRNIEDAHDFNLCLPTLEYHNKTWTWQDVSMALKKDYTQVLVPQIIKEKLHLKGGWDNKQSMAKVDDDDKAKLLLGELPGTQKKTGKKLLFGKLTNLMSNSKGTSEAEPSKKAPPQKEKTAALSGKGVDPLALEDEFNRLRTVSTDKTDPPNT